MASISSPRAAGQLAGTQTLGGHGFAKDLKVEQAIVAVPNTGAGTALNDTINLFMLPKGAVVRNISIRSDALDSNGAPTITLDVGDATLATRFFSASVVAKLGGLDAAAVTAALGFQYTADTMVFATIHAAATTKQAGTVVVTVHYEVSGLPS